jgi:hypothetical protein
MSPAFISHSKDPSALTDARRTLWITALIPPSFLLTKYIHSINKMPDNDLYYICPDQ